MGRALSGPVAALGSFASTTRRKRRKRRRDVLLEEYILGFEPYSPAKHKYLEKPAYSTLDCTLQLRIEN
jgi:hypothetical protein